MAENSLLVDGDFNTANAEGPPRFSQPFDGDNGFYVLEEDYTQFESLFTALPLNTEHPLYLGYYLVKESPLQPVGVWDVVKWTRTYAQIPRTRSDPSSISYNFIGYYGTVANFAVLSAFPVIGRSRFVETVNCRVQYDYYLAVDGATIRDVSGANVFVGTPGVTPPSEAIPTISAQVYYVPQGTISGAVFTPTYTPGSAADIEHGMPIDNIYDAASFASLIPTIPSRAAYLALVVAGSEIVAESSQVGRWLGNIYFRVTKFIIAI